MRRYVFVIALCLGVVVLTGASPIADLISRVVSLEAEVATLEAENQIVSARVASLEDRRLLVTDQNNLVLGVAESVSGTSLRLLLEVDGFPALPLDASVDSVTAGEPVWFASDDCSGEFWLRDRSDYFVPVFGIGPDDGLYVVSASDEAFLVEINSFFHRNVGCVIRNPQTISTKPMTRAFDLGAIAFPLRVVPSSEIGSAK